MKKTIPILLLASFFLIPALAFAQETIPNCCELSRTITLEGATYEKGKTAGNEDTCNLTGLAPDYATKDWGLLCLLSSVYVITDWIFTFLMVFVGIMIIMGALTLTTSAGEAEKVRKGRNYILFAGIGMLVGLLAKAIPAFIRSLMG